MDFYRKHPNAAYLEVFDDNMLLGATSFSCWHCGNKTRWVEINFEAPLCSDECVAAKWREWARASRESARRASNS